jgi:hypothetical protein
MEIPNESHANRNSAKKGVEEKDYAFDMELFGEVIPEVRAFFGVFYSPIHGRLRRISTPGEFEATEFSLFLLDHS